MNESLTVQHVRELSVAKIRKFYCNQDFRMAGTRSQDIRTVCFSVITQRDTEVSQRDTGVLIQVISVDFGLKPLCNSVIPLCKKARQPGCPGSWFLKS